MAGFAETAQLIANMNMKGNFSSVLKSNQKALGAFDKSLSNSQGRAYKAGQQIGTGIKRGTLLAVAGLTALTGLLIKSVKEGQDAAQVQKLYANAIENSGKVSATYVRALNKQQDALLQLSGIDDEIIKQAQTKLITAGLTGKQVLRLTPAILDFAKATGQDLPTATLKVIRAIGGSTRGLKAYGIEIDKKALKTDAFGAVLSALGDKFDGVTEATSGDLPTRLAVLRERLANIREEAGMKLLPVLTKIVDVAGRKLVPAFGAFIDRIMPDVIKGLDQFASILENGGAEEAIRGITDALGPMVELVRIAAAPVKAIVDAFLKLPKGLQTVLIGAFAVNKLTGGLVTNVIGGLGEALVKSIIKTPLVNVQGAVVNVGGPGGIGGAAGAAAGGGAGVLASIAAPVLSVAAVATVAKITADQIDAQGGALQTQTANFAKNASDADLARAIDGVSKQFAAISTNEFGVKTQVGNVLNTLIAEQNQRRTGTATQGAFGIGPGFTKTLSTALTGVYERALKKGLDPTAAQILKTQRKNEAHTQQLIRLSRETKAKAQATAAAVKDADSSLTGTTNRTTGQVARSGLGIQGALKSLPTPIVNVDVNVTPAQIQKKTTIQYRYGPANGSSGGGTWVPGPGVTG